jgi:alpha-tubulin suppressor-like RCC1 family protein
MNNETVVSLSAGSTPHFFTTSNKVFSIGSNVFGQLGTNSLGGSSNVPVRVVDGNNVLAGKTITAVSSQLICGYIATLDGSLYIIGANTSTGVKYLVPTPVNSEFLAPGQYIKYMYSLNDDTFMISNNGSLYAYGVGGSYSHGDGSTSPNRILYPSITAGNRAWLKVSAGSAHTIGLSADGKVYTWGFQMYSNMGQTGSSFPTPSLINYVQGDLNSSKIVVDISAGEYHSILLTSDGQGYGFGTNARGQICSDDSVTGPYVQYARKFDQTIFGGLFLVKVATGSTFTILLTSSGQLWACGAKTDNAYGDGVVSSSLWTFGQRLNHIDTVYNVTDLYANGYQQRATFAFGTLLATPTPSPTTTVAPTTVAPTTLAPTTTIAPTTVAPTTTNIPTTTVAATTTSAPATTAAPITTTSAPTTTIVVPTTTTAAPATTSVPTTSVPTTSIPTTTVVPTTTSAPTTAPSMTTTLPPTLTQSPTTATPGPTNPPQQYSSGGTFSSQVTGDTSKLPPPVSNSSLVLYRNSSVSVVLPVTFTKNTEIPEKSVVIQTVLTFNVSFVASSATLTVFVGDDYGNVAGTKSVVVTKPGLVSVDLADLITYLISTYNQAFSIRAIRGSILKVSLGIETQDVVVNVEPVVQSTIVLASQQTSAPTTTLAPSSPSTLAPDSPSTLAPTKALSFATSVQASIALISLIWTIF